MEKSIKKTFGAGFLAIVFIGIALRVFAYLKNPSFWFDESALAYNVLVLKYNKLFGALHLQQVAPPMFLVITKWLVSIFGKSEMVFRFIPFLFSCLSFIPFYLVSNEIFTRQSAINFAMILFAINPRLIYYGTEFKPFILDVFFSILLFYFFIKIDLKRFSWRKLLACGLIFASSVWFSFTSIIVVAVGLLTLLISQKEWKKWLILFAPVFLNGLVFFAYYLKLLGFYGRFMQVFFVSEFKHFNVPVSYFFGTEFSVLALVISLSLIIGILYFLMEKKKFEIAFMMWTFVLTIVLSLLHIYPAYQRFALFLLPYTILLLAMVFGILSQRKNIQSKIVLVVILCSLIPMTMPNKGSQARELTQYMLENIKENDAIIVDNSALPDFLYYTYKKDVDNEILAQYDKVRGRVLYKADGFIEIPSDIQTAWFYSTKPLNYKLMTTKSKGVDKFRGYTIADKKEMSDGFVYYLKK